MTAHSNALHLNPTKSLLFIVNLLLFVLSFFFIQFYFDISFYISEDKKLISIK